ncbi:hypothetical protein MMC16_005202 [Acarospora aff. strigata]|nr:hypothetical protein [Acarospora aff. strigata]
MPAEDYMSDEYVAGLLKKDAKDSTIKYSALGLQALLPRRPTTNAPKPNTRFLKNIIRETDSHNAALRARETEEAKARLIRLKAKDMPNERNRDHDNLSANGHRSETAERERKRRRMGDPELQDQERNDRRVEQKNDGHRKRTGGHEHRRKPRRSNGEEADHDENERRSHHSSRHHHSSHQHRHRSRSQDRTLRSRDTTHKERRSRSVSQDHDRERSHHHRRRKRRSSITSTPSSASQSRSKGRLSEPVLGTGSKNTRGSHQSSNPADSDSDPLEAIIGPPPPPPEPKLRSRGRGTFASTSAMDNHFSSTYDPSVDVHPNSEPENDWDQALEALRDRQRWKQQGAERLRSAGFTEDEVQKWEKGGEKREADVRWAKKGEGREWDRGKVVDDEGIVDIRPEWGRLKGT